MQRVRFRPLGPPLWPGHVVAEPAGVIALLSEYVSLAFTFAANDEKRRPHGPGPVRTEPDRPLRRRSACRAGPQARSPWSCRSRGAGAARLGTAAAGLVPDVSKRRHELTTFSCSTAIRKPGRSCCGAVRAGWRTSLLARQAIALESATVQDGTLGIEITRASLPAAWMTASPCCRARSVTHLAKRSACGIPR